VGQAMIGEGEAYYKGQKIPTAEALKAIGMKPVKLFGKDALAILSSNACSVGMGRLALTDMAQLQKVNTIAFALSYRDSVFTIGEVNRAYEAARFLFTVQLNSITSALRTTKLGTPDFTGGLERYLGTPKSYHAFGAMEKPPVTLAMENKVLSTPVSCDFLPVAGQVEDVATNAPMVVERLHKQIENSFTLLGIEMIHATQAVDLRHQKQPDYALSPATEKLYKAIRAKVQMLDEDRAMTNDFRSAAEVMRTFQP
jgi:histidine ammonia-lyase